MASSSAAQRSRTVTTSSRRRGRAIRGRRRVLRPRMARPRRRDDVVTVRERWAADDDAIRALNDEAFGGTGETTLIHHLRAAGLAAIELVAIDRSEIVGHIL